MRPLLLLALTTAALPAAEPTTGRIAGTMRFTGAVPPPQVITTTDGTTLRHRDLVVDPATLGLRDVVAVLEGGPEPGPAAKAEPVVIDQKDMVFVPRVVAARAGRAVRFENNDLCNHSVQAQSTKPANNFNRFVGPNGPPLEHTFETQKTPVLIGCSLHPWMRAWVYIVPHPWFAVSDAKGKFQIDHVPPGSYTLWLRHADTGLQERLPVTVRAGGTAEVRWEWKETTPRNAEEKP